MIWGVFRIRTGGVYIPHLGGGEPAAGYTDTQPFPAAPVKWTYRAIYRVSDAQVGVWSQTVNVTVPE